MLLEALYTPYGKPVAATIGFVVFSLYNVAIGLSARSEFGTVFDRDTLSDRRQLMLYGISLAASFLATELNFMNKLLGTTSLREQDWLLCAGFAVFLILVDEVFKFFLRRRHSQSQVESPAASAAAAASAK